MSLLCCNPRRLCYNGTGKGAEALEKTVRKNKRLAVLIHTLTAASTLTATGTLMQTFLASLGLSPEQIYLHATLTQAVNVATLLVGSRWIHGGNALRRYAFASVPYGLLFLAVLPFCFRQAPTVETFLWLVVIGAFQAVAIGLRTVSSYIQPYLLYPAEDYGPLQSLSGILSSLVALGLGTLISWLAQRIPFRVMMAWACCISAVLLLLEAVLTLLLRPIGDRGSPRGEKKSASIRETFCHPAFYTLALPSLLRGIASGTTTVFAATAFDLGFREETVAVLLSLQSAAGLLGCALIGLLSRRISIRYPVLLGSLGFLLLPLFFLGNGPVFLAAATAVLLGRTLVDYGVPILLRKAVPVSIAGTYNAWRMILHTGGTLIATSVAALIPAPALIAVTVCASVLSGCGFFFSRVIRGSEAES